MGNPKLRPVKQCIFCDNPADSGEHAWGNWALNLLGKPSGLYGEIDGLQYDDLNQRHFKVRCVCVECNTGWMKLLEEHVAPDIAEMMFDHAMPLTVLQQWLIAQWALKTVMVFEHTQSTSAIFYTDQERVALRESGDVPPGTIVWIGRALGIDTFYTKATPGVTQTEFVAFDALITTIAFRRFFVQVRSVRHKWGDDRGVVFDGDRARWGTSYERVWPARTGAKWPAPVSVGPGDLDQFHHRFDAPGPPGVAR